jgi:iron complex transport system ATP-binding protein
MLSARRLTVRYPGAKLPALDGVTFDIVPGELVAVTGPNGSGKTTLVRAMLGLVEPAAGDALVDGQSARTWERRELARAVGVVTQREDVLFPLRAREIVMMGRYAHLGALAAERDVDRAAVHDALARCDVADLADRRIDTLSGGEWQRVRVARALAQAPRALVLDEPTASLDVRHEMEVFELVRALATGGLAAMVVTHQLNLAARYADRLLLLDQGSVVALGTAREVLTDAIVTRTFRWPAVVTIGHDGAPQVTPLRPGDHGSPVSSSSGYE